MLRDSKVINTFSDHLTVREIYDYDIKTGLFVYRKSRGPMKAGSVAGATNKDGYVQLRLNGRVEYAHRLAFLWVTGEYPKGFVDHKDTNRANNAFGNLRDTSRTVNNRNKSMMKNNTSGHVGVSWASSKGKWEASIGVNGRKKFLGRFNFYEDAVTARIEAEIKFGYAVDKADNPV